MASPPLAAHAVGTIKKGDISLQELQVNADAKGGLILRLKLECTRFRQEEMGGDAGNQIAGLSFDGQEEMEAAKKKPPMKRQELCLKSRSQHPQCLPKQRQTAPRRRRN